METLLSERLCQSTIAPTALTNLENARNFEKCLGLDEFVCFTI